MVTLGQARYLLVVYRKRSRERTITKIAEELGVTKPSVTKMINSLKEKGLVQENIRGVMLTNQGNAMVETVLTKQSLLAAHFAEKLEMDRSKLLDDMLTLLFELSPPVVDTIIAKIENDNARRVLQTVEESEHLTNFHGILEEGTYEVPFHILKEKDGTPSMGDKGFVHPARLTVIGNRGVISLKALSLTQRSMQGDLMKGRLSSLFFWNGVEFQQVNETNETYSFPIVNMVWDQNTTQEYGVVRLKVQATVGTRHMPESTAVMAIYI